MLRRSASWLSKYSVIKLDSLVVGNRDPNTGICAAVAAVIISAGGCNPRETRKAGVSSVAIRFRINKRSSEDILRANEISVRPKS